MKLIEPRAHLQTLWHKFKCLQNPTADVDEQEKDNSTGVEISTGSWSSGLGTNGGGKDCGKLESSCLSKGVIAPKLLQVVAMWAYWSVEPDTLILREMRNVDFIVNCFDFDLIDESGNVISDKSGVNSLGEINTGTAFN